MDVIENLCTIVSIDGNTAFMQPLKDSWQVCFIPRLSVEDSGGPSPISESSRVYQKIEKDLDSRTPSPFANVLIGVPAMTERTVASAPTAPRSSFINDGTFWGLTARRIKSAFFGGI